MTFTASGNIYENSRSGEPEPGGRARRQRRKRVSVVSLVLTVTLVAGIAALKVPGIGPGNGDAFFAPPETYVARPTPAIDALDDKPAIWTTIPAAEPLYGLRTRELIDLPARYVAREHALGGREDVLAFGDYHDEGLHLRLSIYRLGREAPPASTFFVDLARRSAEAGVGITGMGRLTMEDTKFGPAEITDVRLNHEGTERVCQAFRQTDVAGWQISGWFCDSTPVEPLEIACFLDHLAVTEAARETPAAALFAAANERRRPECGGVPQPVPPKGE